MLTIDGSEGEGGGQILRTALSLSLVTGREVWIEKIRAGRPKPGLLRQHLACVRAVEAIGARVEGAAIGSASVAVRPGSVRGGEHRFSVGSAGSACLVLQTVLPPLLFADAPSRLRIEGGTHNPFAPPFDFIERVFLPVLRRMGAEVDARIERAGFHPAGGGQIEVDIRPIRALQPIALEERGPIATRRATALFANLPASVARRELEVVQGRLGLEESELQIREEKSSIGPGNALLIEIGFESGTEIVSAFGERGVRAESVAERAVREYRRFVAAGAPVGRRLADQLIVPLALAGAGRFRTQPLSEHTRTNIEVVRRFIDCRIEAIEDPENERAMVSFGAEAHGTVAATRAERSQVDSVSSET
jgi:RNA 3'-terminal phosphate cyclase (ATP)